MLAVLLLRGATEAVDTLRGSLIGCRDVRGDL